MSEQGTSIRGQTLRYEQVMFGQRRELRIGETVPNVVTDQSTDLWTYRCEITATGPVFRDVALLTRMDGGHHAMAYTQPVLAWLEFLDLQVEVATPDGTREPAAVDLTRALSVYAEQGWAPPDAGTGGPVFQEGVYFRAVVPGGGPLASGKVLVQIELACPFRGAAADFDPPRAIEACPLYPQISVRQLDPAAYGEDPDSYQGSLTTFSGTVRLVADVDTPPEMRDHMIHELFEVDGSAATATEQASVPAGPVNYAALFTDMWDLHLNVFAPELEVLAQQLTPSLLELAAASTHPVVLGTIFKDHVEATAPWAVRLAQGLWVGFFEYVERIYPRRQPSPGAQPPASATKRFVAVGAAEDPALDRFRRAFAELPWADLPSGVLHRPITKERRQGGYDNLHVHGTMGTVGHLDATDPLGTPRVMAPGCGHSCFHAHWRWGNTTYFLSACDPSHPDVGVLQLIAAAGLADALLVALSAENPDLEDLAGLVADYLWRAGPDSMKPPLTDKVKGWTSAGPNSRSNQVPGAPVIPPNQRLEMVVGPEPAGVGAPLPDGPLDTAVKTVDLRTTVSTVAPYSPVWKHCTTEFPVGVAVRYPPSAAQELFRLLCFTYYLDLSYLPQDLLDLLTAAVGRPKTTAYSASRVFTQAYDIIPFLNRADAAHQFDARRLVHSTNGGTDLLAGGSSTTLEDL